MQEPFLAHSCIKSQWAGVALIPGASTRLRDDFPAPPPQNARHAPCHTHTHTHTHTLFFVAFSLTSLSPSGFLYI